MFIFRNPHYGFLMKWYCQFSHFSPHQIRKHYVARCMPTTKDLTMTSWTTSSFTTHMGGSWTLNHRFRFLCNDQHCLLDILLIFRIDYQVILNVKTSEKLSVLFVKLKHNLVKASDDIQKNKQGNISSAFCCNLTCRRTGMHLTWKWTFNSSPLPLV